MSSNEAIELRVELNPWGKGISAKAPPADQLQLACFYEANIGIGEFDEAVYLHRSATHDELWTRDPDVQKEPCLSVRAPRGGTAAAAALRLFRHLVRSRAGFAWPARWGQGGLIDQATFRQTVDGVEAGLKRNTDEAERRESSIVRTARRLKLSPEPSGTSPTAWRATCPGTNHTLMIGTESKSFGCGYCRRKGGPEELEAFVADRRAKDVKGGR